MEINNLDLTTSNLSSYADIVGQCQEIINENLQVNGGLLKKANIFEEKFNWSNLIVAKFEDKVVGFALVRTSSNTHNLKDTSNYYYLSDIVVKNDCKRKGIGSLLLEEAIESTGDYPLVASVLKENMPSIKLLSKYMECYGCSATGKYLRFVDNKSYSQLYGHKNQIS